MTIFEGSTLERTLQIAGLLPWLAMYLAMSIACVKAMFDKRAPARSASGAMSDSIGLTFCAMWVIAAPAFILLLFALLGPKGFAWWGGGFAFAAGGAWLWELKWPLCGAAACLVAAAMVALGLSAGMSYAIH